MPFEFQLMYDGYQVRKKELEFLTAWQTALLLNAWRADEKSPVIEVGDLLPWVNDIKQESEPKKTLKIPEGRKRKESGLDTAIGTYAKTAGVDMDELTSEERSELGLKAVNYASGGNIFKRAPKEWGNFPE
jgi:hypothetical protein